MSLTKKYLKTKPICRVRFKLEKDASESLKSVYLVGDFNHWDEQANPMTRFKNGSYATEIALEINREYAFKYLIDGSIWENETDADKYAANEFQGENSVVIV